MFFAKMRALSSFGRAPRLHRGGEEFESPRVHQAEKESTGTAQDEIPLGHLLKSYYAKK